MTDPLAQLAQGFGTALTPEHILYAMVGCLLGTLTGILPGLGPTSAIAILLPLTAILPPTGAIIMLAAIYYGSQYGGSTTAILLKIPGEVSSVAAVLDGYPLARRGLGGPALAIAAIGSFVAGTLGLIVLTLLAPFLARFALEFGPAEYVLILVFALSAVAGLSGRSLVRGFISAALGLIIGAIGLDPVTGVARLTFGQTQLLGGINLVAAAIGLFAIAEVLVRVSESDSVRQSLQKISRLYPTREELRAVVGPILRGTGIGGILGIIPGMGAGIVSFIAYEVERRVSRTPERFGQGAIEGVASPESANNASTSTGFIPLLSFGIPASPALAVLLAAFMIYGLQPGPLLFAQNPDFVWALIASMFLGNLALLVLNLPLVRVWTLILRVPATILVPLIILLSVAGTLSVRGSFFDVWVMVAFGALGFAMIRLDIPVAPMVLTILLGPRLEAEFRRTMTLTGGSIEYFLERPIALVLAALAMSIVIAFVLRRTLRPKGFDEVGVPRNEA